MSFPEERAAITAILQNDCGERPTVVDLGAHEGEDSEWMMEAIRAVGKIPQFYLVEADPENWQKIAAKRLPDTMYLNAAIADHAGTVDFWQNPDSGGGYGSIYDPVPGQLSVDYTRFRKISGVQCMTFDQLHKFFELQTIHLLWVDIHGAEKDMIRHGQFALRQTQYLFIECFNSPVYQSMATKSELLGMLPGWTLLKSFPWNMLLRNDSGKG